MMVRRPAQAATMTTSPPGAVLGPVHDEGFQDTITLDAARSLLRTAPQTDVPDLHIDDALVPSMAPQTPAGLNPIELVRLYNAIGDATANRPGSIVQFVSAAAKGSSTTMAYRAAWIGATLMGKRILFIDASQGTGRGETLPKIDTPKRLSDVALGRAGVEEAMVRQADLGLFVATLQHERLGGDSVLAARQVRGLLDALRNSFDMILIAPPPALEQPLAAILTAFVDGTVLVLEAGTSRRAAAAQTVELLSSGGSPILGAVLNQRRNFVPAWLRRWL